MKQPAPEALTKAIKAVWAQEDAQVRKFGLEPQPAGISQAASGWAVPVASGVLSGSAYELARVLDHLQELIESQSKLSVTLFLDPFTGNSAQPVPPKKAV